MLEEIKTATVESTKKLLESESDWFSNTEIEGSIFIKTHAGLGVSVFSIDVVEDYTCVRIPMDKLKGLRDCLNTVIEPEEPSTKQEEK